MSKKIAILQSNYIPWKGYFDLLDSVDEFIIFDEAQYTKNDWRNRNRIKTRGGLQWLTIPIRRNFGQKISEAEVESSQWAETHWKSLQANYAKADNFHQYAPKLEKAYETMATEKLLSTINYVFIAEICKILGITTKISHSTDYRLEDGKTTRLISLCQQASGSKYVSGPAAKSYLDENAFVEAGIELSYFDYSGYPEYKQLFPPFVHEVSVVDLLLNMGAEAREYLKHSSPKPFATERVN